MKFANYTAQRKAAFLLGIDKNMYKNGLNYLKVDEQRTKNLKTNLVENQQS